MAQIDIEFATWKRLTAQLIDENDDYNKLIVRLLDSHESKMSPLESNISVTIRESNSIATEKIQGQLGDWISKNVLFPEDTEFRGEHEGAFYYAKVQNGALYYNGERFDSPSSAAMKVRNYSENGWRFWECKRPGEKNWVRIGLLRRYGKGA